MIFVNWVIAPVIASPKITAQLSELHRDIIVKQPTTKRAAVVIPERSDSDQIHYQLDDERRHDRDEVQGNILIRTEMTMYFGTWL